MSAANFSESHVGYLLRTAGTLSLAVAFVQSALRWGAILLLAGLVAVLVDGLLGLHPWGLLAADLAGGGLVLAGGAVLVRTVVRHWYEPRSAAKLVESRLGLTDGRLVAAWDLGTAPPPAASRALVQESLRRAQDFAKEVPLGSTVRTRPLLRGAGILAGLALLGLAGLFWMPRLFAAVLPRLADPFGDHPPFTLVEFEVTTEPRPVLHGRKATIVARLGGPEVVERANVVFFDRNAAGRWLAAEILPMLRRPEGEFVLPMDRVEKSREFYIDTPRGRSGRFRLDVLPVPTFEATTVRYRFPEYTGWPESQHPLDSRGLRGLEGTRATVTATSNVPLREGTLTLTPPDKPSVTVLLRPDTNSPTTVSAEFALAASGLYQLTLTGADGTPSRDRLEGPLTVVADLPPQIEIVEPAPLTLAVEDWQVPVQIAARDDVAVETVVVQATVNGWGPHPQQVALDRSQPTAVQGQYVFDLKQLGAAAGDILTFYATARDNRPPAGQTTDTPMYVIQVISQDEYFEMARSKYRMDEIAEEFEQLQKKLADLQRQRERLLSEAEKLQEQLDAGELDPEGLERLQKLQQQLDSYQEAAEKLAQELAKRAGQEPLYDFEKPFNESLKKLGEQMQKQSSNAKSARDAAESLRKHPTAAEQKRALEEALEKLREQNYGLDAESLSKRKQTGEDLQKLKLADELLAQAERLQSLVQQQRDLAERMKEFRDSESLSTEQQERARKLAKEQELLEQELSETADAMEQLAGQCEKSLPKTSKSAKKLAQAIRDGQIPSDQQGAAKAARQGHGKDAADLAEQAAQKLEALQCESCNADGMGDEMDLDGGLSLPKAGAKSSLKQLAQGRSVPGLGQKPGEQGRGQGGSQARVSIAGPHLPSSGRKETRDGRLGEGGQGRGESPDSNSLAGSPESLDPQARRGKTSSAGTLRGVPVRYRDQAEAFFRRLAEEK